MEVALFVEGEGATRGYYEVVVEGNGQEGGGLYELLGECHIGCGGCGIARGVVVGDDVGGGAMGDSGAKDFARMDENLA